MTSQKRIPETTRQHQPTTEHEEGRAALSGVGRVPQVNLRTTRWSARRRRDAWFLLAILLLGIVTIFALSNGAATVKQQANSTQSGTPPASTTSGKPTPPARVLV